MINYENNILIKSARYLVVLLLTLSLAFPTAFVILKTVVLFVILILIVLNALNSKSIYIYKPFVLYSFICGTLGLIFMLHGLIRYNPGATNLITVMIIYPLVLVTLISLYRPMDYKFFERFFITLLCINLIIFTVYIFARIGLLPNGVAVIFDDVFGDAASFSLRGGMPNFALKSIESIFFLFPFLLFYTAMGNHSIKKKSLLYGLIFITVILVILTGRRALPLVSLMSVSVVYILYVLFVRKSSSSSNSSIAKRAGIALGASIMIGGGLTIINAYEFVNLEEVVKNILSSFNFSSDDSNLIRVHQYEALMNRIEEYPLFGNGMGAAAAHIRNVKTPWAYELSYIAFIFHYGTIAFVFYTFGIIWLFSSLILMARKSELLQSRFLLGVAAGYLSFIVANATNPYLGLFDFMWIIFLPASIISSYNLYKKI